MITNLLRHTSIFSSRYKTAGIPSLNNCQDIPEFQSLLNHVKQVHAENVGLIPANIPTYFRKGRTTFFKIEQNADFSIGVFCLSKGCSLALHDHPSMLVISKVLLGSIHVRSLDLLDKSHQVKLPKSLFEGNNPRVIGKQLEAVVHQDRALEKEEVVYLTPERGNVHCFTALEDSAILDILTPDYDMNHRYCNFYTEVGSPLDKNSKSMFDMFKPGKKEENVSLEDRIDVQTGKSKKVPVNAGDKTVIKYIMPPMDMGIDILNYKGEPFKLA